MRDTRIETFQGPWCPDVRCEKKRGVSDSTCLAWRLRWVPANTEERWKVRGPVKTLGTSGRRRGPSGVISAAVEAGMAGKKTGPWSGVSGAHGEERVI